MYGPGDCYWMRHTRRLTFSRDEPVDPFSYRG